MIIGFDVSNVNGTVPRPTSDEELVFRLAKATQGTDFSDQLFPANRSAARQLGELFAAYHFLTLGNARAQAQHFANYVHASGGFSGIGAVVDVEYQSPGVGPTFSDLLAFGDEFRRLVPGKPLVIYTFKYYWTGHLGNPTGLHRAPLHDANWVNGSGTAKELSQHVTPGTFSPYGGWSAPVMRQYSDNATVGGHRPVDVDETERTLEQLREVYGVTAAPVPRPQPNPVHRPKHPFTKLAFTGRFTAVTIDALQWLVHTNRDGICGRSTALAVQRYVGAAEDGLWARRTTAALQRFLNTHGRRWFRARLAVNGHLDHATVTQLQRYLNKLAGY